MNHTGLLSTLLALPLVALAADPGQAPAEATACTAAPAASCMAQPAPAPAAMAAPATAPVSPDMPAPFYVMGSTEAPVAMVEFSDLQCPFCARYALQVFPEIKRAYIDTGKLHYAASDFPLEQLHAQAFAAAVAARCAGEQGRFWEFREAMFADQQQLGPSLYVAQARKLGLDEQAFQTCLVGGRQGAEVREAQATARASGIGSTPSFVIGRVVDGQFRAEIVRGALTFEEFAAKIDALLGEAAQPPASEHSAGP